jgi:hypothetical protein
MISNLENSREGWRHLGKCSTSWLISSLGELPPASPTGDSPTSSLTEVTAAEIDSATAEIPPEVIVEKCAGCHHTLSASTGGAAVRARTAAGGGSRTHPAEITHRWALNCRADTITGPSVTGLAGGAHSAHFFGPCAAEKVCAVEKAAQSGLSASTPRYHFP